MEKDFSYLHFHNNISGTSLFEFIQYYRIVIVVWVLILDNMVSLNVAQLHDVGYIPSRVSAPIKYQELLR